MGDTIKRLEKQFSSLQRRLLSEIEVNSKLSPEVLLDSMTQLPIALRGEYQKFVLDNLKTLEKADSTREIFRHISLHFTFIDYGLQEYIIENFGSNQLKRDMSAYAEAVQVFLDETTVQQLMDHWPARHDIPSHFNKLIAVIDEDPSTYNLRKLDNLRKEFCREIRLSEVIFVVLAIVGKNYSLIESHQISILRREDISSVTVGKQQTSSTEVGHNKIISNPVLVTIFL